MNLLFAILSVLFVGDSLTSQSPGYVDFAGGGERAITYYLADSILFLEEAGRYDRIVLELGIHAVRGSDRLYTADPVLFRRRYGRLLDVALQHADEVIVVNVPWLDWGPANAEQAQAFNRAIQELASARGVRVVDAWSVMAACGSACIGPDGFHPNALGHQRIAAAVRQISAPLRPAYLPAVIRAPR